MATDVEMVRGIAMPGRLEFLPARRKERMQDTLQNSLDKVSRPVEVPDLSDEKLMALLRAEDSDALHILFDRHSRLVYSIALRILHDAGEAEEIVQECFMYIYRKALSFEPARGSAKVWIVQVAYSRARDRKMHLSRRGFYLHTDIESDGLDSTLVGNADVGREIEAKLDFNLLQCAFEELTESQRETLKLFYFEDLELREISERLHEPLGNVRHHFYRGLERLRHSAVVERLRNHRHGTN